MAGNRVEGSYVDWFGCSIDVALWVELRLFCALVISSCALVISSCALVISSCALATFCWR